MTRAVVLVGSVMSLLALGSPKTATGAELRKHALLIGINGLGLNFADRDAQEFASFLETPAGGGFPSRNVRVLINSQASREGILVEGIAWVGKRVRDDRANGYETLVYIFFAGHGQKRSTTSEAYLLPAGANPDAPQGLGIRADDFMAEIRKEIPASRIVYFFDACHAGAAVTQGGVAREVARNVYSSMDALFQNDLTKQEISRMGFMSAQAHQESFEDPNIRHGVFTYYLLKGLQSLEADQKPFGNEDGVVNADELARYLEANVPVHVKGMFAGNSDAPRQYPEPSPGYDHDWPLAFRPLAASLIPEAVKKSFMAVLTRYITEAPSGFVAIGGKVGRWYPTITLPNTVACFGAAKDDGHPFVSCSVGPFKGTATDAVGKLNEVVASLRTALPEWRLTSSNYSNTFLNRNSTVSVEVTLLTFEDDPQAHMVGIEVLSHGGVASAIPHDPSLPLFSPLPHRLEACASTNITPGVYRVSSSAQGDGHVLQRANASDRLSQINKRELGQESVEIGHYGPEQCYFVVVNGGCVTVPENNWGVTGEDGLRIHNGTNRYGPGPGRCEEGDNDKWSIIQTAGKKYIFQSKRSGLCLERRSQDNGKPMGAVQQGVCSGVDYQSWRLEQTGPPALPAH